MPIIKVTASLTYEYDTDDGIITTEDAAVEDVADTLISDLDVGKFVFAVTNTGTCDRHGGDWGTDETCENCTDENGQPLPYPTAEG